MNEHDYALIIGFTDYDPSRMGLNTLAGPANDMAAIREWLEDASGGDVPPANIETIPSEPGLQPCQYSIDDKLLSLVTLADRNSGDDARRFYFFYCGHGQTDSLGDREDTALCLPSWTKVKRHRALSSHEYAEYLRTRTSFSETWMFLDCCRVKEVRAEGFRPTIDSSRIKNTTSESFTAFAASALSQAFEDVNAAEPQGHFTKVLIAGLRGGAMNKQGKVTIESLKSYMNSELPVVSSQQPQFLSGFNQAESDVVIVDLSASAPAGTVNVTLSAGLTAPVQLQDSNFATLGKYGANDIPGQHSARLAPGLYSLISGNHPPQEANFRISQDGETVDVTF